MVPMHDVILKNDRQESVCVCWGGRGGGMKDGSLLGKVLILTKGKVGGKYANLNCSR